MLEPATWWVVARGALGDGRALVTWWVVRIRSAVLLTKSDDHRTLTEAAPAWASQLPSHLDLVASCTRQS